MSNIVALHHGGDGNTGQRGIPCHPRVELGLQRELYYVIATLYRQYYVLIS